MIGNLDQRIILQSLTETAGDGGQLTQAWTTISTVWGHVISVRGQEALEAARLNAKETIRIKIRYRDDITTAWRVQWQSQNYSVQAIDRSERRTGFLWVTAQAVGKT